MGGRGWTWPVIVLLLAATSAAGVACAGGDDDAGRGEATTATTAAPTYRAEITGEQDVDGNYRQGLAADGGGDGGWVLSTNNSLFRTDGDYAQTQKADPVIPAELASQGFDHVGDIDITDGVLWAPLERPDRDHGQVIARYDPETLAYVGSETVDQHHASFVTADEDGVVYSMDQFDGDDTVLRYRWTGELLEPIEPLRMDRTLRHTQGGDVAGGALYLSTDDDRNGVYRVDLETGKVTDLGSAGRVDGEGEGIDATDGDPVELRVLIADPAIVPMWVVDMTVTAS